MRPLRDVMPTALLQLISTQPLTEAKVQFAWKTVAGPAMSRATMVELQHGIMRVTVVDAHWRREVRRLSPVLCDRLGTLLGAGVVKRLTIAR